MDFRLLLFRSLERIGGLIEFLLPRYAAEGKAYITLAFGCTGGRHRSVHIADQLGERLRRKGFSPTVVHRDMGARPDDMVEGQQPRDSRSEEHTSELQSLMRITYAVFCLKQKNKKKRYTT